MLVLIQHFISMPGKYLTKEGFQKLNRELEKFLRQRAKIAQRIEDAKALGDLSENADYIKAKEEQSFNEGKIRKIEQILSSAEVITQKKHNNHKIEINSLVKVEEGGNFYEYKIVGPGETDPLKGKISYESPLGQRFLGRRKNDVVEIETPGGKRKYKIIDIK